MNEREESAAPWRALGVTLLATALAVGLEYVPLPGGASEQDTLAVIGLTPIIFGYLLVELAALLVPGWRALRTSGPAGRARLAQASERAGMALALAMALWMFGPVGAGLAAPSAVAGAALLVLLARWTTRRGVGNGYAILLVLPSAFFQGQSLAWELPGAPGALAPLVGSALLAVGATYLAVGRPLAGRRALPVPASGLLPLTLALYVGSLGYWLSDLLGLSLAPTLAGLAFTVGGLAIPLFAWLFNRPDLQRALAPDDTPEAIVGRLWAATIKTAGWLAAIATAIFLFPLPPPDVLYFDPVRLVLLTAVALDLADEWRARRASPGGLVEVWPEHRLYALSIIEEALGKSGIPVLFRSRHLRVLLQLLGPHVPVQVCVPADRAQEARNILATVLGGPSAQAAVLPAAASA